MPELKGSGIQPKVKILIETLTSDDKIKIMEEKKKKKEKEEKEKK